MRPVRAAGTASVALTSALLALLVGACSSDSSGVGPDSGLAHAMDRVSGSGPAAKYFEYGDLAALRKLGVINPRATRGGGKPVEQRWNQVAGVGFGSLAPYTYNFVKPTGLNLLAADTAITIGNPPNSAVRLDGSFDASDVTGKLKDLGAKQRDFDGTDGLSFAADNEINQTSKLYRELMLVSQLDQVVVTKDQFVASPNAATLGQARGTGTSLLHTGSYGQVAQCLGDVVAAIVIRPVRTERTSVLAVGVLGPKKSTDAVHEVVCAVPKSGRTNEVKASFHSRLGLSAVDPARNEKLSALLTASSIGPRGKLVRAELTGKKSLPPGFVIEGVTGNLAAYWDGSCSDADADVVRRHC